MRNFWQVLWQCKPLTALSFLIKRRGHWPTQDIHWVVLGNTASRRGGPLQGPGLQTASGRAVLIDAPGHVPWIPLEVSPALEVLKHFCSTLPSEWDPHSADKQLLSASCMLSAGDAEMNGTQPLPWSSTPPWAHWFEVSTVLPGGVVYSDGSSGVTSRV